MSAESLALDQIVQDFVTVTVRYIRDNGRMFLVKGTIKLLLFHSYQPFLAVEWLTVVSFASIIPLYICFNDLGPFKMIGNPQGKY